MPPKPSRPDHPSDASLVTGSVLGASATAVPFEAMFLASPLPTSVTRLSDGCVLAVNDAWLALAGCERESVVGHTGGALGFWSNEAQRQAFVDALDTPGATEQRHLLRLAGGAEHSVRIHGVKIQAGSEFLLLALIVEVTREIDAERARERTEAALREMNQSLERRVELHSASERLGRLGYWTNAADEDKVIWSDGLYEIANLPRQEEIFRSHGRSGIHPDDLPNWLAAREAKDGRELEYRWSRPDGKQRWFRTRMGQTAVAGNPQTDFGVVQDITVEHETRADLAQQLSLLRSTTARLPGLIYRGTLSAEGAGTFSFVNDRAWDMLEMDPLELQQDARKLFLRVHADDRGELLRTLTKAAKSLTIWRHTHRICLSQGRIRWHSAEAVPLIGTDGTVVWHGFTTDVTEQRLVEQRLERQHRMLAAVREAQAIYIEADDKRRAFEGLLAAFLSLTDSGYGFVGEVYYNEDGSPYLRTHAITNIAWDEASRLFYESQRDAGMAFRNLRSLFGQAMVTGQPVMANDPRSDPRAAGLPAGHPPMDAFLGIPLSVGGRVVAMVGLANQPGGYGPEDVAFLQPLLGTVRQLVLAMRSHAERQHALAAWERTSRALAEKSDALQATLDSISQGLTQSDANGRLITYNQQALALLDLPETLLQGQPSHESIVRFQLARGDFGDELALIDPNARPYFVQPNATVLLDHYSRKTRDGRTLDVHTRHLPDGGVVRTFSDVTSYIAVQDALRTERQRLAWVLEATRPGIWEFDLVRDTVTVNARWTEMLGYSLEEMGPLTVDTWWVLVHPEDGKHAAAQRAAHLASNVPYFECDFRMKHKQGHWVWINSRGRVHQRDAQGRAAYMSGTHLDISERVAAQEEVLALNATLEQRVQERTAELERSVRDMEAVAYSIAHDLRAPLRAVNGFSAVIAEEAGTPLGPVASDMFARINTASRRMGQMLTDMLEMLRVVRTDLDAVSVDLQGLAETVAEVLAHESPQAKIAIEPLPMVLGDASLLRQMLHNLMENGLKYARHRTAPELTLRFDDSLGAFCLSDNGMGFDMAHAGKLFGLFQRLHAGIEVPGTGVGLAIVARIIERHGGHIWAEAQPNVGAHFWWTLPRA